MIHHMLVWKRGVVLVEPITMMAVSSVLNINIHFNSLFIASIQFSIINACVIKTFILLYSSTLPGFSKYLRKPTWIKDKMTRCVFPELLVLRLEWVGGGEGLVVVAEAGALAVDPPLLPVHPVQLILLRLVARRRLLLGVQVVVEVVVRIKVAAARGLQVAKIGIFHIGLEMQFFLLHLCEWVRRRLHLSLSLVGSAGNKF